MREFVPTGEIGHRDMPSTGGRSAYREAHRLASELAQCRIERDEARGLVRLLLAWMRADLLHWSAETADEEGAACLAKKEAWDDLPAWIRVALR